MKHIVLLGDSIFDNGAYVPGGPAVIDQLRAETPNSWQATLLAVDGNVTSDVRDQLELLPSGVTDVVVSVGGNDALGHFQLIEQAKSAADFPVLLADILPSFRREYTAMLDSVAECKLRTSVCTVYDQCPFPLSKYRELVPAALTHFNDVIIEEANRKNFEIIELREVCTESEDYSSYSPIEPSANGGQKIVQAIMDIHSH